MISLFQLPRDEEHEWPAELRAAVAGYPRVSNSPQFEANFWRQMDARRARAATFQGKIERFVQVQIGGLCVWRLLGSSLAGAALPALGLCLGLVLSAPTSRAPITFDVPAFSALAWRQLERETSWKTPFKTQTLALWLNGENGFKGGAKWPNVA